MRTSRSRLGRGALVAALALTVPTVVGAQPGRALDRTVQPKPASPPRFDVPGWTKTTLPNGAELIVSEKHDLPLVAVTITFVGGNVNFEPPDKVGVGAITGQMLAEGTTTRTGEQLADAQQMLGTSIGVGVRDESGVVSFTALKDRFEPALALLADMMLNPSFPNESLERLRGRTLVSLTQARDQPNAIAANVFAKVLYGDAHPYGRIVTEQSIRAITREDVVAFHRTYFRPGRAVINVTGDVQPAVARAAVEKALAQWPAGGERPKFDYPAVPAPRATTIYLVDKPKAAQSVFQIGHPGPSRDTPDYYALQVMNNVLGVLFQSRLNHNIREEKGYSYGVSSGFAYGRGPGAFEASGGIVTAKTDSALIEFMKELRGVQGSIPFTNDEITQGKESLIYGMPRRFASVNGIGSSIAALFVQDLPPSFYKDYAAKISAVTRDDMVRVAMKYIDLDHLDIVIVGDRATIEEALRKTGIAPIMVLDVDGRPAVVP